MTAVATRCSEMRVLEEIRVPLEVDRAMARAIEQVAAVRFKAP